ncbi:24784_t:CDS:2 [Cetraspora pellucida]|uniref:24784_t:CDS:1 n=1 Tax=Cetraspora pellucida TaxID=1433469 RepID=A0A9N9FZQ7_9GLOM|nr:24784_t:CDS:2 [Cetraspora pellucida]
MWNKEKLQTKSKLSCQDIFPDYDNHRVFLLPFPSFTQFIGKKRDLGVYFSGSLFALGWWFFIDAVVLSNTIDNDTQPAIGFEDWMCGISSFALMAGGLARSVTILILKHIVPEAGLPYIYFGIEEVIQNVAIVLSSVVLWISQNAESDNIDNYLI